MGYLYGDGSEFPLQTNLLTTLRAATDACVSLLEIDEAQQRMQRALEEENTAAIAELAELGALRGTMDRALVRAANARPAVVRVAGELREIAFEHVEKARAEIRHRREELHRRAAAAYDTGSVLSALERLLTKHELPNTSWALSWWAGIEGRPCQALAYALMPRGLAATMEVAITPNHLWSRAVRVSHLGPKLALRLEGKSWLGGRRWRTEHLDRYYVTRVSRTPTREALLLSRHPTKPSPGMVVVFREGEDETLRIVLVDAEENPVGRAVTCSGADKVMLQQLWSQVERSIADLVHHRSHIRMATVNGRAVTELDRTIPLVRALVSALTPWVRNIRRRSRGRGQLTLLHDDGNGYVREFYLSFYDLLRRYRHLSALHQGLFDSFGLTDEPRAEPQTTHWQPGPAAAAARRAAEEVPPPRESQTRRRADEQQRHLGAAPRISAVRPAARRSRAPTAPLIAPDRLPPPAAPPRHAARQLAPTSLPPPVPTDMPAAPATEPPPPLAQPAGHHAATMVPPPMPQAAAAGGYDLPPLNAPPAPRPRLASAPTRPALRLVRG